MPTKHKNIAQAYRIWEKLHRLVATFAYKIPDTQFIAKPNDKKWSVAQSIQHIILSETQILERMLWCIEQQKVTSCVGPLAFVKTLFVELLFALPIPLKAPEYVAYPPNTSKTETLQTWNLLRYRWQQAIDSIPPDLLKKGIFKHPLLGYLNLYLTIRFMSSHLQRHYRQIKQQIR